MPKNANFNIEEISRIIDIPDNLSFYQEIIDPETYLLVKWIKDSRVVKIVKNKETLKPWN
jgi:hypothetical protein